MELNAKLIKTGIKNLSFTAQKAVEELTPAFEEDAKKLSDSAEFNSMIGKSLVQKAKTSFLSKSEFSKKLDNERIHLYNEEEKGLYELAKTGEDSYDTSYIKLAKELKATAADFDGDEPGGIDRVIKFLKGKDGINEGLKNKVTDFIAANPEKYNFIRDLDYYHDQSPKIKESLFNLLSKLVTEYEDIGYADHDWYTSSVNELIGRYIGKDLPENIMLQRIKRLESIADVTPKITPVADLFARDNYYAILSDEECTFKNVIKLGSEFLDSNIVPTEGTVSEYLKNPSEFWNLMKPFTDNAKLSNVRIEDYALKNVIKNENSPIRKYFFDKIDSLDSSKNWTVTFRENTINPKELRLMTIDRNTPGIEIINADAIDKVTGKIIYKESIIKGKDRVVIKNEEPFCTTVQKFNTPEHLAEETLIHKDKNGKTLYTELTKESAVEGQYDMFRVYPDGKIEVLAKTFKDPETGEIVIKRNFTGFDGAKTEYNYKGDKKGNYSFDYLIKDENNQVLMNRHQTYKVIDEHNFESTVNGKKYKINDKNNIITVKTDGEKPVELDLNKLVPTQDPYIMNLVKGLPGHELMNLQSSRIKEISHMSVNNNAAFTEQSRLEKFWLGDKGYKILLGDDLNNSNFAFLHEFGHCKDKQIDKQDYEKIINKYRDDVNTYNANTSISQGRLISYLIDSDHYLNDIKGAIGELVPDTNGMINVPSDSDVIGIRTLRAQQHLAKSIAEISKYL